METRLASMETRLDNLRQETKDEFTSVRGEFASIRREIATNFLWTVGILIGILLPMWVTIILAIVYKG